MAVSFAFQVWAGDKLNESVESVESVELVELVGMELRHLTRQLDPGIPIEGEWMCMGVWY